MAEQQKLDLTKDQKALLYQLANMGYKPETNPFSTRTGKTVYDTNQEEKDHRENGEEGDERKEKSGPRWENGRLVLPKFGESGVLPRR